MPVIFGKAESENGRVVAFSDGVLAVIITIMALELRAPVGGSLTDLRGQLPALLVYILSFAFIRAKAPMSLGGAMRQHG